MRRFRIPAIALVVVVALGACSSGSDDTAAQVPVNMTPAADGDTTPKVTAHGIGRVTGKPDLLTVVVGVETRAPRAADALNDNNGRAASLIALLKERGVEAKDIQTSQLSVNPDYDREGRRITGYVVNNLVTAKLRDLDNAGRLIDDAAARAGDGIRVQGLNFSIEDTSKLVVEARKDAVKAAREQAQQLAEGAGVKLGSVISIEEDRGVAPPPHMIEGAAAGRAADAASVPIESGSQELTLSVTVVYAIG